MLNINVMCVSMGVIEFTHKVELSVHLCFPSPSDVQVSPLARPSMVSVHILAPKAQETVHAHIQASLTLLHKRDIASVRCYSLSLSSLRQNIGKLQLKVM